MSFRAFFAKFRHNSKKSAIMHCALVVLSLCFSGLYASPSVEKGNGVPKIEVLKILDQIELDVIRLNGNLQTIQSEYQALLMTHDALLIQYKKMSDDYEHSLKKVKVYKVVLTASCLIFTGSLIFSQSVHR